ncbi:site-specific recombinase phage integrase family [Clostridium sp. CAG:413]|nr:site-specific recombinase phage integrase family [Clostridium sp. CAG:413]
MIKQILGKGSVYAKKNKYGNRYWYLEVRYLDENDEQHKKYIRGVTRRDAFANGDEFIQQTNEDIERINKNEASDCKNVSFNEFCADYLEKVCKRKVKDSTYLRYVTTFKKNLSPQLGDMLMKDISTFDIIDCINKLVDTGLSESTVKKAYLLLSKCFAFYKTVTGSSYSPLDGVEQPRVRVDTGEHIKCFTPAEMERIRLASMQCSDDGTLKYANAIVVLAYSGLRVGELLALTWDDVDLVNNTIHIGKTISQGVVQENGTVDYSLRIQNMPKSKSGERTIVLHPYAKDALIRMRNKSDGSEYVVSTENHNPVSPGRIYKTFGSILNRCDFQVNGRTGVHSLRHSFATYLIKAGLDSDSVAVYLGHSTDAITKKFYIHDKENIARNKWLQSAVFCA